MMFMAYEQTLLLLVVTMLILNLPNQNYNNHSDDKSNEIIKVFFVKAGWFCAYMS